MIRKFCPLTFDTYPLLPQKTENVIKCIVKAGKVVLPRRLLNKTLHICSTLEWFHNSEESCQNVLQSATRVEVAISTPSFQDECCKCSVLYLYWILHFQQIEGDGFPWRSGCIPHCHPRLEYSGSPGVVIFGLSWDEWLAEFVQLSGMETRCSVSASVSALSTRSG